MNIRRLFQISLFWRTFVLLVLLILASSIVWYFSFRTRDKLAQLARGREFEAFDRSLDVQISRLRKLIEVDPAKPRHIQTVWGVGYVFVPDTELSMAN
jgi:DNA-binding response OmpR family regulator